MHIIKEILANNGCNFMWVTMPYPSTMIGQPSCTKQSRRQQQQSLRAMKNPPKIPLIKVICMLTIFNKALKKEFASEIFTNFPVNFDRYYAGKWQKYWFKGFSIERQNVRQLISSKWPVIDAIWPVPWSDSDTRS